MRFWRQKKNSKNAGLSVIWRKSFSKWWTFCFRDKNNFFGEKNCFCSNKQELCFFEKKQYFPFFFEKKCFFFGNFFSKSFFFKISKRFPHINNFYKKQFSKTNFPPKKKKSFFFLKKNKVLVYRGKKLFFALPKKNKFVLSQTKGEFICPPPRIPVDILKILKNSILVHFSSFFTKLFTLLLFVNPHQSFWIWSSLKIG